MSLRDLSVDELIQFPVFSFWGQFLQCTFFSLKKKKTVTLDNRNTTDTVRHLWVSATVLSSLSAVLSTITAMLIMLICFFAIKINNYIFFCLTSEWVLPQFSACFGQMIFAVAEPGSVRVIHWPSLVSAWPEVQVQSGNERGNGLPQSKLVTHQNDIKAVILSQR